MKKTLLFTALTIGFIGNSQSLTQANEAAIGEMQAMFVCDSFVDMQENVTGSGITWDFTTLDAYSGQTRDYEILDASTSPFYSDFSTSTKTLKVASIETFYNSITDKVSQGFVYDEPSLGDIKATFETDEANLVVYDMSFGDSFNDTYSGTLDIPSFGQSPLSGEINVIVDGQGTLNLPNGVSYSNVIRVVSMDSSYSALTSPFPTEVIIERTQYEYYDIANSNLPVLLITNIKLINSIYNDEQTLVLAVDDPMRYVGLNNNTDVTFTVSPNPASDQITVTGEFSSDAIYTIIDQSGRKLSNGAISNGKTIDISSFDNGMYFLNISSNGNSTSKTIVKK